LCLGYTLQRSCTCGLGPCVPWLCSTALVRLWPWPSDLGGTLQRSSACGRGPCASALLYGAYALAAFVLMHALAVLYSAHALVALALGPRPCSGALTRLWPWLSCLGRTLRRSRLAATDLVPRRLYSTALECLRPRPSGLGYTLQRSSACGRGPRASVSLYSAHAAGGLGSWAAAAGSQADQMLPLSLEFSLAFYRSPPSFLSFTGLANPPFSPLHCSASSRPPCAHCALVTCLHVRADSLARPLCWFAVGSVFGAPPPSSGGKRSHEPTCDHRH